MKQLILQRAWSDNRATLGMLSILDHDHDPIFTLENPLRKTHVDSRIPCGEYECEPYSGTKFKDVYILKNVPKRSYILIHWGNFEKDTEGCILLGLGSGMLEGEPSVSSSKAAFKKFRNIVGEEKFNLWIRDTHDS